MESALPLRGRHGPEHGRGKVFAAVFPHSDDFSIMAGGLLCALLEEGYTGYFIRTTNDEMDSYDLSAGETIYRIERETREVAAYFGIAKVYDLNYKNHYLDHGLLTELRHRLITLFRFLRVDVAISFDPWGHYEENPDHTITAMAVEQACWMAGRQLDLPELTDMGLAPRFVTEKYYMARGPQQSNLLVDIGFALERKRTAIAMHKTPIDNMWKEYLAAGRRDMVCASKEEYVQKTMLEQPAAGGVEHWEKYRYIGPGKLC